MAESTVLPFVPRGERDGEREAYLAALDHADAPSDRSALMVRSDTDVEHLPPVSWLVDRVLPRNALAAIYGPPGSGKSFVALDLALSVAAGVPWLGRQVVTGSVLYLAAEGLGGLGQRVRAWKASRGLESRTLGVGFVTNAVNLLEPGVAHRVATATENLRSPLQLIVVDTLARSMIGDENDTGDMSRVIAALDQMRVLTGATVMPIHHTRKDSELERGSSALRGGLDTLILCQEDDAGRQLTCQKQKDAESFEPIPFHLAAGRGSCVVAFTGGDSPAGPTGPGAKFTPLRLKGLQALAKSFSNGRGATATEWLKASSLSERTYYSVKAWLLDEGYVSEIRNRYTLTPSGKYAASDEAAAKRLQELQTDLQSGPSKSLSGDFERAPVFGGSAGRFAGPLQSGPELNDSDDYADFLAQIDERAGISHEEN